MDNTDYGSAMNEAALRDKISAQEKRIRTLEQDFFGLQRVLVVHLEWHLKEETAKKTQIPKTPEPPKHPADASEQQPHGWHGYFGDAGGPLK